MQTFKEYIIEEGKLSKALGIGVVATQSLFGDFVDDWSKYYQTSQDPAKEARAERVLNKGFNIPLDAKQAIKVAAYIFDGDDGHSAKELTDYLEKTGAVESGYRDKVQIGGGPARSYWQVEPKTAMDLVKNSSAYFGNKFHKVFGDNALKILQSYNEQQMAKALLDNDALAASFAAAKWIASAW